PNTKKKPPRQRRLFNYSKILNLKSEIRLITVVLRLKRPLNFDTDISSLLLIQSFEFNTKFGKVQSSNFFVKVLRQHVNLVFVFVRMFPKLDLRKRLVRERV